MLNVVAIMGRLARDPELRQTTTGKNVASFRIACDRGRRDANGQSQADWIDVVAWDRQAEFVCKYFQKGSLIVVDGRLQSRSYQDKTGANPWQPPPARQRSRHRRPAIPLAATMTLP